MFYSIKIKKRKRFYLASFLDVSQEMMCFLIQKRFFMKHICNMCAKTMVKIICFLGFIPVKMILSKGM